MRLADIAEAEFASELDPAKRHSLKIEEWRNTTVYWGPWTADELDQGPLAPDFDGLGGRAKLVRIIRIKAKDADGKPLIVQPEEEQLLRTARPEILDRLGAAIMRSLVAAESTALAEKK